MSTVITIDSIHGTKLAPNGVNNVEIFLAPTLGLDSSLVQEAIERAESAATSAEASETAASASETNAAASEASASADAASASADAASAAIDAANASDDADRAELYGSGGGGLTKAAFEVARALRKRQYAGSGFAEWGKQYESSNVTYETVNQGIWQHANTSNAICMGETESSQQAGTSRTARPIAIVDGVEFTIGGTASISQNLLDRNYIEFPTAPDGSKSLNPTTGEVHKYHDLAGVGEAYETYSVDFDANTQIDLTAVPYNMADGSKVEFKFKWDGTATNCYLIDSETPRTYIYRNSANGSLLSSGLRTITLNGEPYVSGTVIEQDVEYHLTAIVNVASTSVTNLGARYTGTEAWRGEIWDIKFEDPALTALGIPPRHYLNADWQAADDAAPDNALVVDRNGYTTEDWTPAFNNSQWVEIPEWVSPNACELSFVADIDSLSGNNYMVVGKEPRSSAERMAVGILSNGTWYAHNVTDFMVDGVPASHGDVAPTSGTHHVSCTVTAGAYIDYLGRQYNTTAGGLIGSLTDFRLIDNTNPENSRYYPLVINSATQPDTLVAVDEGYDKTTAPFYSPDFNPTSRSYVEIPVWLATDTSNNSVNFKMKFDTVGAVSQFVLGSSANGFYFGLNGGTGKLYWAGYTEVQINGVPYNPQEFTPVAGVEYTVTTRSLDTTQGIYLIGSLGKGSHFDGRIWDVEFTDNTDPTNSRYYPSLDYRLDGDTSGTVLEETLQKDIADISSGGTWTDHGDGSYTETVNSGSFLYLHNANRTETTEWELTVTVTDVPASLSATGGTSVGLPIGTNTVTITGYDPRISANSGCIVSNITLNKLNDGQLVNFPVGSEWTLAQVDGATDGTLENFTVGSEWDNDLGTDGTLVGTTLRTPMTLQDSQKCFLEAKYTDFEPIISRKDLVFLETWREKVVGFVRPFGNVQFGGTSHDGVTLVPVTNFVAQGYSAFGEWDENTVGEVADWDAMSVEEKAAWTNNPKNNLFYDSEDNEHYQESYRIRVVEGLGDDWINVRPTDGGANGAIQYTATPNLRIRSQGSTTETGDYTQASSEYFYQTEHSNGDSSDVGRAVCPYADKSDYTAIALVQRLNQGAYHPTWNSEGTGHIGIAGTLDARYKWYEAAVNGRVLSTEDAFALVSTYPNDGAIGTIAARTDQYDFYDAIYAGQVEDLRLNANKQDYARLLTDRVRDGVAGETRGKGKVPFTKPYELGTGVHNNKANLWATSGGDLYAYFGFGDEVKVGDVLYIQDSTDGFIVKGSIDFVASDSYVRIDDFATNPTFEVIQGSLPTGTGNGHTTYSFVENELSAEYDSLPWVDIIGDPERIAATFPDGVVGQWIPDLRIGTLDWDLNRKSNQNPITVTWTDNDGVSWSNSNNQPVNTTTNRATDITSAASRVLLLQYEALSDFTESDDNRAVEGDLGDVTYTNNNSALYGNRLAPSLVDVIGKTSVGHPNNGSVTLTDYNILGTGELHSNVNYVTKHLSIPLGVPQNDSDAVKALPHLVEKDGLLYVQYHATQLVYDGTVIPSITMSSQPIGIDLGERFYMKAIEMNGWFVRLTAASGTGTFQSYFDAGTYWCDAEGNVFSGTDLMVFKKVNTSADWGDDSEITIVDGEAEKGDLNGNVVKVVTHTEQIPVGIANKNQTTQYEVGLRK